MPSKDVSLHFDVFRAALSSHPVLGSRQNRIAPRVGVRDIHRAIDLDCWIATKLHLEEPRGWGVGAGGRRRDGDSNNCFPFILSKHELKRGKTGDEYSYAGLDYAPVDRGRNANYINISVCPQRHGVGFSARTESMIDVSLVECEDKWNNEAQADQGRRDRAADY